MSVNGNTISWATNWTWANAPNNVKTCEYSFSSLVWSMELNAID